MRTDMTARSAMVATYCADAVTDMLAAATQSVAECRGHATDNDEDIAYSVLLSAIGRWPAFPPGTTGHGPVEPRDLTLALDRAFGSRCRRDAA